MKKENNKNYFEGITKTERSISKMSRRSFLTQTFGFGLSFLGLGIVSVKGIEAVILKNNTEESRNRVDEQKDHLLHAYRALYDRVCTDEYQDKDVSFVCEQIGEQEYVYDMTKEKSTFGEIRHEIEENIVGMIAGGLAIVGGVTLYTYGGQETNDADESTSRLIKTYAEEPYQERNAK